MVLSFGRNRIHIKKPMVQKIGRFLFDPLEERVCGLVGTTIVRNGGMSFEIIDMYAMENMHAQPTDWVAVGQRQIIDASRFAEAQSLQFLGLAHSHGFAHPPQPSQADFEMASNRMPLNCVVSSANWRWTFYSKAMGAIGAQRMRPSPILSCTHSIAKALLRHGWEDEIASE